MLVNVTYTLCALVYKNLSNLGVGTSALNLCSFLRSAAIWPKTNPWYIFLCWVCAHRRMQQLWLMRAEAEPRRNPRGLREDVLPPTEFHVLELLTTQNTFPDGFFSPSTNPPPTQQGKELHRLTQMSRHQPYSRII